MTMNMKEILAMAPEAEPARQKYFMELARASVAKIAEEKVVR